MGQPYLTTRKKLAAYKSLVGKLQGKEPVRTQGHRIGSGVTVDLYKKIRILWTGLKCGKLS